jgi:hypothetical protein
MPTIERAAQASTGVHARGSLAGETSLTVDAHRRAATTTAASTLSESEKGGITPVSSPFREADLGCQVQEDENLRYDQWW